MSEWNKGWPDKRGLYRCRVDGKEKFLVHHHCELNGKHWWSDTKGFDVVGCQVEWQGKHLTADEV